MATNEKIKEAEKILEINKHRMEKSLGMIKGKKLKHLMIDGTVIMPGVFNPLTAKLAKKIGFQALYISGAGLHQSWGLPDTGGLYSTKKEEKYFFKPAKYLEMAIDIIKATDLPTIIDIDTGFGSTRNLQNAVKQLEEAGAAGIQIEDQAFPKKCGHLDGKEIISVKEMKLKIKTAVKARGNPDFLIVARTDARCSFSVNLIVDRAMMYKEFGADIIFPEALKTKEEFRSFYELCKPYCIKPMFIANMTEFGKTPYLTTQEFKEMGYSAIIFPVSALRVAMKAIEEFLLYLKETGTQKDFLGKMQTRQELYDLIGYKP